MPGCNGRDRGCNITLPEREQTSVWSFFAREFEKFLKGVKQMNRKLCAAPHAGQRWQDIDFANVEKCVKKLQMRIAKAAKEEKWGKVKALQWTLTHSYYAKVLAVKQVTENRGKRTSGVDHELWDTPDGKLKAVGKLKRHGYRPSPLRRVYIPKKNGKLRPLSIPTMTDRAIQTLYRFALDPVAETTADTHSYGFRKGRCVQDAIEHCFTSLSRGTSPAWILEGDIKGFSPHDLLTAYIKNTLSGYPRLEDQNLDDLTLELLYPTDEAAEHCIKEFLALRLDDDNEHELEQ